MREKVCLIIPCFNEEKRIDLACFATSASDKIRFVFVDDGSTDRTSAHIASNLPPNSYLLSLPKNVGKAEAIRQGFFHAKKLDGYSEYEWIGYWDADLATPLDQLVLFISYLGICGREVDAVFGSRVKRLGSRIERSYFRHFLGRGFATVAFLVLKVQCYDSQCGAKIIRTSVADAAFTEPFISKWIFDLEVMLRLREGRIVECPLSYWQDVRGSKLGVAREFGRVGRDILKIRRRYRKC
jgi:dolichyl-phosphate beta-glucosyltransferase